MLRRQVPGSILFPAKAHLTTCAGRISKVLGLSVLCFAALCSANANETANADAAQLFNSECAQCHSVQNGAPAGIGPNLHGIVGSDAGRSMGNGDKNTARLSGALKKFAVEGGVWDAETLDTFLKAPEDALPGTLMNYQGLQDAADRLALINWLADPSLYEIADSISVATGSMQKKIDEVLALNADPDYGEYLAGECQTCHVSTGQTDSASGGAVPPIGGLPAPHFIKALLEYKDGTRDNQVMQLMVENLGDEELASLAVFFSTKTD